MIVVCGRFTLFTDFESLIDRFDIEYSMEEDLFIPSYNIAPSQQVVSIINDANKNRLCTLRWGLIPRWATSPTLFGNLICGGSLSTRLSNNWIGPGHFDQLFWVSKFG